MFSRSDLDELVASEAQPAVSIYLPTHVAGREIGQDPIRLKNLVSMAAERLATSRRGPEIDAFLAPARRLIDDGAFWRHQGHGLAVFLAPDFGRVHKLPIAMPEEMVLGSHFHIKPLLPLLDDAGGFWLLAISAARTRLYQGSRWDLAEIAGLELPRGVAEIRGESLYEETNYGRPTGRHGGLAKAQSFGDAPDEVRKAQLIELLHRVAAAVEPHIKRRTAPVILAASPEIQGHFREIAGWREVEPQGISENPDARANEELHRRAYAVVEQRVIEARATALDRLNGLLGTGKATAKPEEIVSPAHYGRVDTLFVSGDDEHLWGRFDEREDRVFSSGSAGEGDIDLLDYAVLMTLRHRGSDHACRSNGIASTWSCRRDPAVLNAPVGVGRKSGAYSGDFRDSRGKERWPPDLVTSTRSPRPHLRLEAAAAGDPRAARLRLHADLSLPCPAARDAVASDRHRPLQIRRVQAERADQAVGAR